VAGCARGPTEDLRPMESDWVAELAAFRQAFHKGSDVSQKQIDELSGVWGKRIRPAAMATELLVLVDDHGQAFHPKRHSPRWLCHLLSLRHKAAHVLLIWDSPRLGPVFVCQVRSWTKADYPGFVDISVGGHLVGDIESGQAALIEMQEEIGVSPSDLVGELTFVGGYDGYNESDKRLFYDAEWRDVYIARVKSLDAVRFTDGEVVGIYLCPQVEARNILAQDRIPVAHGLRLSLPICLRRLEAVG
jgi:isopentenyldiphosphate isomerase